MNNYLLILGIFGEMRKEGNEIEVFMADDNKDAKRKADKIKDDFNNREREHHRIEGLYHVVERVL